MCIICQRWIGRLRIYQIARRHFPGDSKHLHLTCTYLLSCPRWYCRRDRTDRESKAGLSILTWKIGKHLHQCMNHKNFYREQCFLFVSTQMTIEKSWNNNKCERSTTSKRGREAPEVRALDTRHSCSKRIQHFSSDWFRWATLSGKHTHQLLQPRDTSTDPFASYKQWKACVAKETAKSNNL